MRGLKYRADPDRELLPATRLIALPQAKPDLAVLTLDAIKPASAINGAAIAGGCVLACACDRRLIGPEALIGAAEVRVGVPFPVAALEIMRYACGNRAV